MPTFVARMSLIGFFLVGKFSLIPRVTFVQNLYDVWKLHLLFKFSDYLMKEKLILPYCGLCHKPRMSCEPCDKRFWIGNPQNCRVFVLDIYSSTVDLNSFLFVFLSQTFHFHLTLSSNEKDSAYASALLHCKYFATYFAHNYFESVITKVIKSFDAIHLRNNQELRWKSSYGGHHRHPS